MKELTKRNRTLFEAMPEVIFKIVASHWGGSIADELHLKSFTHVLYLMTNVMIRGKEKQASNDPSHVCIQCPIY